MEYKHIFMYKPCQTATIQHHNMDELHIRNMVSFSLFSFSCPQDLRNLVLNSPTTATSERANFLRSKCTETLLAEGNKGIRHIQKLVLGYDEGSYLVLYCDYNGGFVFPSNKKIIEMPMYREEKVLFRIFSRGQLELSEMLFYIIYRELDANTIRPYGRNPPKKEQNLVHTGQS